MHPILSRRSFFVIASNSPNITEPGVLTVLYAQAGEFNLSQVWTQVGTEPTGTVTEPFGVIQGETKQRPVFKHSVDIVSSNQSVFRYVGIFIKSMVVVPDDSGTIHDDTSNGVHLGLNEMILYAEDEAVTLSNIRPIKDDITNLDDAERGNK